MAFSYAITATSFAALSSIVWLTTGGTFWAAVGIYVLSGQIAMLSLVLRAALTYQRHETAD